MGNTQALGNVQYRNIVGRCQDRHISVNEMCSIIGIRPSLLSDLKSGRSISLSVPTLMSIAGFFEISIDDLVKGGEKE